MRPNVVTGVVHPGVFQPGIHYPLRQRIPVSQTFKYKCKLERVLPSLYLDLTVQDLEMKEYANCTVTFVCFVIAVAGFVQHLGEGAVLGMSRGRYTTLYNNRYNAL